jgi:hypothetical protein
MESEGLTYWRFFVTTLLRRPRQFYRAMELTILGYHFRRVANGCDSIKTGALATPSCSAIKAACAKERLGSAKRES